ncbi:MAG: hypothetical protein ACTSPK_00155 [Candidatus Heimdallarchaeota archaeon]
MSKPATKIIDMVKDPHNEGLWTATKAIIKYNRDSRKLVAVGDSLQDPFWEYNRAVEERQGMGDIHSPIETHVPLQRRWATAVNSPKGHFITYVAGTEAFKDGWEFVKYKTKKEKVEDELRIYLEDLTRDYDVKSIHQSAVSLARALGKCLVVKMPANSKKSRGRKMPVRLRVVPIEYGFIEYDSFGEPEIYKPLCLIGRFLKQLEVNWKDAVLYVHKRDPFGNGYHGIPETYPVYNQLKWMANIQKGWATAMNQRGISMIHFSIPNFDMQDLTKWKTAYGKPSAYSVIFTDKDVEVKQFPNVNASFDLDRTNDAWAKEVASSSGMAVSRIDGTQRGQVTGSQTDTDNYYGILVGIQESNNLNLLELYEMLDSDLSEKFDIDYQIAQKLDEATKTQIMAQQMSIVQMGGEYLTYNRSLEILGEKTVGKKGDVPAANYIAENIIQPDAEGGGGGGGEDDEEGGEKETKAAELLKQGVSVRKVNEMLKEEFGTGMSHSKLVKLRGGGGSTEPTQSKDRKVDKTNKNK